MGISSFTINPDRLKEVDMVSYFNAGTQWATQPGNPKGVDPDNACGKNIAVQTGTVQETDDLPPRQKACGATRSTSCLTTARPRPQARWSLVRLTPCWPTRQLWRTQ